MAKIVVVDDAAADRQLIQSILSAADHEVVLCEGSTGAEQTIAAEDPDIVFLDVVMPERSGYEVLRSLKKSDETNTVPVVLVSSKGADSDVSWGFFQGADGYVVKPFETNELLEAVERYSRTGA